MENDQVVHQPLQSPTTTPEDALEQHQETFPLASTEQVNGNTSESVEAVFGAKIAKDVQLLVDEMQSLRHDFDTKVKYDESKERQIDSLHRELQAYREGFHFKILRPLFIDLIAVHDDLGKL